VTGIYWCYGMQYLMSLWGCW